MSYQKLRSLCKEKGLSAVGRTPNLIDFFGRGCFGFGEFRASNSSEVGFVYILVPFGSMLYE
jgi:hypothetical protein